VPGAETAARRRQWESLAAAYWKPVYAYLRARFIRTDEDALDCAQAFFLHLFESDFLERADPARGRFRGYVKVSLANFVHDLERRRHALKRGGGRSFVSLASDEGAPELPDVDGKSPEDALDDAWRGELLETATRALEEELAAQGRALTFTVFREYFLADEDLDYAAVAARHGIQPSDVSNHLQAAKRRFRAVLRATVADTVGDEAELSAELAWLFERSESR